MCIRFACHKCVSSHFLSPESYVQLREDREPPERRPHSVSAKRRRYGAHVCPCLASEVIAQGFFDAKSPSWSGEISTSIMYRLESHSLLLRVTCYEGGGAPVAHYGLQPGGANDVEAPARPGASSQLCSKRSKNGVT